ncbi:MAG: hypothetical protein H6575_14130 [Lewinellaceae bacterium]|nr:hypothetical protein [Lewinellaceae bacterium]
MSDFYQQIGKKLQEEGRFPNREKNWRTLAKRLNAYKQGTSVTRTPRISMWKIAATLLLLLSAWLGWSLHQTRVENAFLAEQLLALSHKEDPSRQAIVQNNDGSGSGSVEERRSKSEETSPDVVETPAVSLSGRPKVNVKALSPSAAVNTGRNASAPAGSIENYPETIKDRQGTEPTMIGERDPQEENITAQTGSASDSTGHDDITASKPEIVGQALADVPLPEKPDSTTDLAQADQMIRPVKAPGRIQTGIQGLVGFTQPKKQGISLMTGHGVAAEYRLFDRLWVTASADWVRFNVKTKKFERSVHHHKGPPDNTPPTPFSKLQGVESTQRQQHYGLGLKYSLPMRSWIRPAVRVAYTLVRISPETVNLNYKKPGPMGEKEYVVKKFKSAYLENVWRFGFGLEHETPRWVFGLWADYSKNFSVCDKGLDSWLVRGGIQYRIN